MTTNNNATIEEISVQEVDMTVLEAQDKALIDRQIATAKQYPRNLHKVKDAVIALVSMDAETASSCGYVLPRGGSNISGPSVHLARIVIQQYGNIRVDAKISNIDRTHVTGQATCIDLENNVGIRVEVKRKITNRNGARYNDDMITVTGNAAAAIALRNAVFAVVPKPIIDAGYKSAQHVLIGDISDEQKLIKSRKTALDLFKKDYEVDEKDVLQALGIRTVNQIHAQELISLRGMYQALKDGDSTVTEMFFPEELTKDKYTPEQRRMMQMIDKAKDVDQLEILKEDAEKHQVIEYFNTKLSSLKTA